MLRDFTGTSHASQSRSIGDGGFFWDLTWEHQEELAVFTNSSIHLNMPCEKVAPQYNMITCGAACELPLLSYTLLRGTHPGCWEGEKRHVFPGVAQMELAKLLTFGGLTVSTCYI